MEEYIEEEQEEEEIPKKRHYHRRKKTKKKIIEEKINYEEIPGVIKRTLNAASQKYLGLIVGDHVTSEKPWKFITKERLEDDLDLHEETTELEDIREEIVNYPGTEILIGYVPAEGTEIDEFYFCLIDVAANKVTEIIEQLQEQRAERLQNTVEKTVRKWKTQGSEKEVEDLMNKCNRPLLEVELETKYPIITPDTFFKLRRVEDARDGYLEMICRRYTFNNLTRRRVDSAIQSAPVHTNRAIQTVFTYPKNAWTQYGYEFDTPEHDERKMKRYANRLIEDTLPPLEEDLLINSCINFYQNDYGKLILNPKAHSTADQRTYKEIASLHDVFLSKNKVIGYATWHPMWTGTLAHSYSNISVNLIKKGPSTTDEVTRAVYDQNYVLFWCTRDTLQPRLLLESPKEVTFLTFCPFDENILVGGCANGQIIIWDITNKLKEVEEVEVLTIYQQNYRKIMRDMMDWMKFTKDVYRIRPVVSSNIIHSHTDCVTNIEWIQPQYSITKMGHIQYLEDKTSFQFITSSTDGYLMFWDLLAVPTIVPGTVRPPKRLKRLKKKPSALTLDVSPFKVLNRILKPFYKIQLSLSADLRPVPITSFSYKAVQIHYREKDPDPYRKVDLMKDRIYYTPDLTKPTEPITKEIHVSTLEGDVAHITWEGYKYSTGEVVTSEIGTAMNFAKYHDAPVTCLKQNLIFTDIYLSVGGKVFAVWKKGFLDQPIFWKRSKFRYTFGSWMRQTKSNIVLVNEMGYKEFWDIALRITAPISSTRTYNVAILQSATHPFPYKKNLVAVSTANAALNLFYFNLDISSFPKKRVMAFKRMIDREVKRKTNFQSWQKKWSLAHPEIVNKIIEEENQRQKYFQEQQRRGVGQESQQEEKEGETAEGAVEEKKVEKETHPTAEQLQKEWKLKEKERMTNIMLSLKHLNPEVLQQQQIPLKKLEEEIAKKKEKQKAIHDQSEEIFNKSVAMNFPEAIRPKTPPPPDPYAVGDMEIEELEKFKDDYQILAKDLSETVRKSPYTYKFNWSNLLDYGRNIRKFLDAELEKQRHRYRYEEYKQYRKNIENELNKKEQAANRMARNIIYTEDGEEIKEEEDIIEENEEEDPSISIMSNLDFTQ